MRRESFLAHVQERGEYETPEAADRVARVVLTLLGAHLVGNVRAELAARWIEGATEATALWDIGAVLAIVTHLTGPDLLTRILRRLPAGYALLFGQAELRRPQPTAA
jgi:uncharacterized protein (DUF2267 family)